MVVAKGLVLTIGAFGAAEGGAAAAMAVGEDVAALEASGVGGGLGHAWCLSGVCRLKGKGCRALVLPQRTSSLGTPRLRQPWKFVYISIIENRVKLVPPYFSAEFLVCFV